MIMVNCRRGANLFIVLLFFFLRGGGKNLKFQYLFLTLYGGGGKFLRPKDVSKKISVFADAAL